MICGYAARKDTVVGRVALWFPAIRHSAMGWFISYSARNTIFLSWSG